MSRNTIGPNPESAKQEDLAGRSHWTEVYERPADPFYRWEPKYYEERVLSSLLLQQARRIGAKSILEVGCGNSLFLPYLARTANARVVAGLDYEPKGCELAKRRLEAAGVHGDVHCRDFFEVGPVDIGEYDLVYSLGVVEHFSDTVHVG